MQAKHEQTLGLFHCRRRKILLSVAAAASLSALAAGAVLGWALGAHPRLLAAAHRPPPRVALWVHTGLVAGAASAAVFSDKLAECRGRRGALAAAAALLAIFWLALAVADGVLEKTAVRPSYTEPFQGASTLLNDVEYSTHPFSSNISQGARLPPEPSGRSAVDVIGWRLWVPVVLAAVGGHALGAVMVVLPLYLCEIAPAALRGALGGLVYLALTLGALGQVLLQSRMPAMPIDVMQALVAGTCAAVSCLLPQSPAWLVARGRENEALFALMALRMCKEPPLVVAEIKDMRVAAWPLIEHREPCLDLFRRTGTRKALGSVLAVLFLQYAASVGAIGYWAGGLFTSEYKAMDTQAEWLAAQAVGALASVAAADALGRRVLLAASGVGVAAAATALGSVAVFAPDGARAVEAPDDWATRFAVGAYAASLGLGLGPLPWTLLGDLFAAHARSQAAAAALLLWAALQAAAAEMRLLTLSVSGAAPAAPAAPAAFAVSAIAGAAAVLYALISLPEAARRHVSALVRELEARRAARGAAGSERRTQSLPSAPSPLDPDADLPSAFITL